MRSGITISNTDEAMVIDHIFVTPDGQNVIVLRDGTTLELSDNDVEMLEMSFPSECENCGYDPSIGPFDGADDEDEDE